MSGVDKIPMQEGYENALKDETVVNFNLIYKING